jgi:pimeloyl-ACP methyl ester carboxylesterase
MKRGYATTSYGQMHYYQVGEDESPGVLFLGQVPSTGRFFLRLAEQLAPKYRVICMDNPGFGNSDPFPDGFTVDDMAKNAVEVLDDVGIDRVRISGHHTGATVAGEVAAAYPDRVAACAPTGYTYRTAEEKAALGVPKEPVPSMFLGGHANPVVLEFASDGSHLWRIWQQATSLLYHGKGAPGVVMFPPENLEQEDLQWVNDFVVAHVQSLGRQVSTLAAVRAYDPDERLPLVKAPTLFVESTGPYEPKFLQRVELLQKLVPGSQTASVPNGDIHVIHFHAETLGKILMNFFDGLE